MDTKWDDLVANNPLADSVIADGQVIKKRLIEAGFTKPRLFGNPSHSGGVGSLMVPEVQDATDTDTPWIDTNRDLVGIPDDFKFNLVAEVAERPGVFQNVAMAMVSLNKADPIDGLAEFIGRITPIGVDGKTLRVLQALPGVTALISAEVKK